jgi:hypothetical protein
MTRPAEANSRSRLGIASRPATPEPDARDPDTILCEAAGILDFSPPVAVMVLYVTQYIQDSDNPHQIVSRVMDAMPPGSYLTMSDTTRGIDTEGVTEATGRFNARRVAAQFTPRTREEIAAFFDGLDLVDPGLVPRAVPDPGQVVAVCGCIGRKP